MKNYKVKATRNFFDKEEQMNRIEGEEFFCTKERYEELISRNNAVELLFVKEEKPIEEEKEIKTTPKKTYKKKSK